MKKNLPLKHLREQAETLKARLGRFERSLQLLLEDPASRGWSNQKPELVIKVTNSLKAVEQEIDYMEGLGLI